MASEENRWRDLLAASADAIIEFDRTGVVTWASPAVEGVCCDCKVTALMIAARQSSHSVTLTT